MVKFTNVLTHCIIFKRFNIDSILKLLSQINYKINLYSKDTIIAYEGDNCFDLGIILEGSIEVKKLFVSGNTVTIRYIWRSCYFFRHE